MLNKRPRFTVPSFMVALLATSLLSLAQGPLTSNLKKVIIWNSPSGHGNTPVINDWIKAIGVENGFTVDATSDPTLFTTLGLRNYNVIYSVNGDLKKALMPCHRICQMAYTSLKWDNMCLGNFSSVN